jgi:hypothetical protein
MEVFAHVADDLANNDEEDSRDSQWRKPGAVY